MPKTVFELHSLAHQAAQWLNATGLPVSRLPEWSGLPFPGPESGPIHVVRDVLNLSLLMDVEHAARAYRQEYDPEELAPWAFVPGSDGRVWLVSTKRIDASVN